MKIVGPIACLLLSMGLAFFAGIAFSVRLEAKKVLREAGLTKDAAKLLGRAGKILNRMVRVTDLYGEFSPDLLSPETQALVKQWVSDYEKEIKKV